MNPSAGKSVQAIVVIALLLVGACSDGAQHTTPIHGSSIAASTAQSHLLSPDVEDRDHGGAIQRQRLVSLVSAVEPDDFQGASSIADEVDSTCGTSLAGLRFEDPSDVCWAAFSSAMLRQQFDQAVAAVRIGCEKYRRSDYCEVLPELTEAARLHVQQKDGR